jgi:hypothetical protein
MHAVNAARIRFWNQWRLDAIPDSSWKWASVSFLAARLWFVATRWTSASREFQPCCAKRFRWEKWCSLEFTLPPDEVELLALVRQRSAFRYGFQFLEERSAHDVIGRSCSQLAVEQPVLAREKI